MKKIMFLTALATLCTTGFAMDNDLAHLKNISLPSAKKLNKRLFKKFGICNTEMSLGEILGGKNVSPLTVYTTVGQFLSAFINLNPDDYDNNPTAFIEQLDEAHTMFLRYKLITLCILQDNYAAIEALQKQGCF